ncbi:HTTM domain-containing protein, partial [Verrucomicrobiales bacterium]|nr:HTTM domain-containing protein [Verrucomicrobiales bacterium]
WDLFRQWNKKQINLKAPQYGLVLIQLQVFIIYWQTVIQKLGDQYWAKGESITYFLLSHHGRFTGSWPVTWHELFDKINYLILLVELAIPILLWIRNTRRLGLWIGIGLHLSIAILGINLALFSLTMIVSYLAFTDPWPTPHKLRGSTK